MIFNIGIYRRGNINIRIASFLTSASRGILGSLLEKRLCHQGDSPALRMSHLTKTAKIFVLSVAATVAVSLNVSAEIITYHSDKTHPKLVINPNDGSMYQSSDDELVSRDYLNSNAVRYGLDGNDLESLTLVAVKKSLTAKHFHYQQHIDDINIDRAEIIVSVDLNTHRVTKVFNNTQPISNKVRTRLENDIKSKNTATAYQAMSSVWALQLADSRLLSTPQNRLVFIPQGHSFQLVYRVNLTSSKLSGSWEYTVDAHNGEVIAVERLDTPNKVSVDQPTYKQILASAQTKSLKYKRTSGKPTFTHSGAGVNPLARTTDGFDKALDDYNRAQQTRSKVTAVKTFAAALPPQIIGSAQVFDPDPRTTLNNENLTHLSPASAFNEAYLSRNLLDITLVDGVYSLIGPWVSIIDWELPTSEPSTTTDGNWTATRDELAFYDSMAYFHIDQNQRYLQSLGFVGDTAIQDLSIEVDTNGVNGRDNAFFDPAQNRISFGTSEDCISFAEDADVILHEYGHAIQEGIVENWVGFGEGGVIGEGFSDYWGGSYSYSTANGPLFHPEWAGSWSGHGDCWDGRLMDRIDLQYDPDLSYYGHQQLGNGVVSDELWSTPLFQSLLSLSALGVPREEVDTIIIEAHFGLGSGVNMPEMALATIQAAENLYPDGPHRQVFREKFNAQHILPFGITLEDPVISAIGDEGQIDAGEIAAVSIVLENTSGADLENLSVVLSSRSVGVTFPLDTANYPVVTVGQRLTPPAFRMNVSADVACGSFVDYSAQVEFFDTDSQELTARSFNFSAAVGENVWDLQTTQADLAIPDSPDDFEGVGVESTLQFVDDINVVDSENFRIFVDITHTYMSDLRLILTSPSGTELILARYLSGFSEFNGYIPGDHAPFESLSVLNGEPLSGEWRLRVIDEAEIDVGVLNSWGVSVLNSAICNTATDSRIAATGDVIVQQAGENNIAEPGETFELLVPIQNNDVNDFTDLSITLSGEEFVAFPINQIQIESIEAFTTADALFQVTLEPRMPCDDLRLNLNVQYTNALGEGVVDIPLTLPVGAFELISETVSPSLFIPDDTELATTSELVIANGAVIQSDSFSLSLELPHTFNSDLEVILRSPQGTEIIILNRSQFISGEINGRFPEDYPVVGDFADFDGESATGTWTLLVRDIVGLDVGTLESWGISMQGNKNCSVANESPIAKVSAATLTVEEGQSFSLDASSSSDPDQDAVSYLWQQLTGPTIVISDASLANIELTAPQVTADTTFTFSVMVTDIIGASNTAEISVTVTNKRRNSSGGGGGGAAGIFMLLILGFMSFRKFVTLCRTRKKGETCKC